MMKKFPLFMLGALLAGSLMLSGCGDKRAKEIAAQEKTIAQLQEMKEALEADLVNTLNQRALEDVRLEKAKKDAEAAQKEASAQLYAKDAAKKEADLLRREQATLQKQVDTMQEVLKQRDAIFESTRLLAPSEANGAVTCHTFAYKTKHYVPTIIRCILWDREKIIYFNPNDPVTVDVDFKAVKDINKLKALRLQGAWLKPSLSLYLDQGDSKTMGQLTDWDTGILFDIADAMGGNNGLLRPNFFQDLPTAYQKALSDMEATLRSKKLTD